jgi:VanZ family protein
MLILYWPAFFFAAHTPVPQVVRQADVSDKGLHLLAYLILVFLLWFTVSDGGKVNWRRAAPWCVFFIAVVYSIFDEWSQSFVAGRSCDGLDFVADLAGTCIGLCAFSFLSFWPAGLLVMASIVLIGGNIARANLADLLPGANAAFHLICYAVLTALWLRCIRLFTPSVNPRRTGAKWLMTATAAPTALLLIAKLVSIVSGREWAMVDIAFSATAIALVVAVFYAVASKDTQDADERDCPA